MLPIVKFQNLLLVGLKIVIYYKTKNYNAKMCALYLYLINIFYKAVNKAVKLFTFLIST